MASTKQAEIIQTAFNSLVWARAATDPRAEIRAENILLDACIDAGMSHDEPNHIEWAAMQITQDLVSL